MAFRLAHFQGTPRVNPKYVPRPGSQAETLVKLILAAEGSLRTGDLVKASGISSQSIHGCLEAAISNGLITCCKVTVGNEIMREYRAGPGMPHATEKPLAKPLQGRPVIPVRSQETHPVDTPSTDQPAVSHNTGNVPRESRPPAEHIVAEKPPAAVTPLTPPAGNVPWPESRIGMHITDDAELAIFVEDEVPLYLSTAQTVALGDFLHATQALWRP
jgi:hypothetical protein